jgi:hypothetical protein
MDFNLLKSMNIKLNIVYLGKCSVTELYPQSTTIISASSSDNFNIIQISLQLENPC